MFDDLWPGYPDPFPYLYRPATLVRGAALSREFLSHPAVYGCGLSRTRRVVRLGARVDLQHDVWSGYTDQDQVLYQSCSTEQWSSLSWLGHPGPVLFDDGVPCGRRLVGLGYVIYLQCYLRSWDPDEDENMYQSRATARRKAVSRRVHSGWAL